MEGDGLGDLQFKGQGAGFQDGNIEHGTPGLDGGVCGQKLLLTGTDTLDMLSPPKEDNTMFFQLPQ